mgnify:CR=1 FL=1
MVNLRKLLTLAFVILFSFINCGKSGKSDYIAKVGDEYLDKEKLLHLIPESKDHTEIDEDFVRSLISDWVKNEILYQNAQKYHFDQDKKLQYKADQYFRDLVVNKYLKYHFQNNVNFSEHQLKNFYNENKEIYKRKSEDEKMKHFFKKNYN